MYMNLPPITQEQTANLKCYNGGEYDLNYVVNTINKVRKDNNMPELIPDERLNTSATQKARDMVNRNYWSHTDPDGKMAWDLIKKAGFSYSKAGENLASVYDNVDSVEAWMRSPDHLENILDPDFTHVGYAKVGPIKVMHFGTEAK
jgi:uncharacterized protein YkwD